LPYFHVPALLKKRVSPHAAVSRFYFAPAEKGKKLNIRDLCRNAVFGPKKYGEGGFDLPSFCNLVKNLYLEQFKKIYSLIR